MSAVAAPYGLRPVRSLVGGGNNSGITRQYLITDTYTTSIFYGDIVHIVTAGTVEKLTTTNSGAPLGVFLGCSYTDPTLGYKLHSNMWLASTAASDAYAYVCDDPTMLYTIQSDESVVRASVGLNFSVVQTAGNTAIGMSKIALDGNTGNTTNTLPVRLVDFNRNQVVPANAVGDAFTDVIVRLNTSRVENIEGL